ncbi:MAG: InlB B-repeat-containing protein [Bacteroidales bacterium]|nr:InlB B-repeat-containing protein [Bacteroidales bacterium]
MKRKIFLFLAIVSVVGMIAISGCGKEKVYRVSFDANGGTGEMKEQAFAKDRPQILVSNAFTRVGYLFDGWNTISDGSGDAYTDAQEIVLDEDITLYAQWKAHEWVDLGLPSGTKWAAYNVGATKPEEYGDYFAWGETQPKNDYYTWGTYKYCTADFDSENNTYTNVVLTKYNEADGKTILDATDDAATANWGSNWRMPTAIEMRELIDNCTWENTTQGGVQGWRVIGSNGNSIFLPNVGARFHTYLYNFMGVYGAYWTNSLANGKEALFCYCNSKNYNYFDSSDRYRGYSVRPICQ